jgi:phosphoadenosine phosphosulfate reductase
MLSGGKDSIAMVYLFREHLDRVTVYHCDTGDLMPETNEVVAQLERMCPRFVRIKSDVRDWIAKNGIPTDLFPVQCGPVGRLMHHGEAGDVAVVDKFACCTVNRWLPIGARLRDDGATLTIYGTRRSEPGYGLMAYTASNEPRPHTHSDIVRGNAGASVERWFPLEDWSDQDVFAYLHSVGAPIPRYYECGMRKGAECARCPAGWGAGRAEYLMGHHPDLAADYASDLRAMRQEIEKPLANLERELKALQGEPDSLPRAGSR